MKILKCSAFQNYLKKEIKLNPEHWTHMLTNLRTHACKSGFDFFDKEVFLRVFEKDNNLLP